MGRFGSSDSPIEMNRIYGIGGVLGGWGAGPLDMSAMVRGHVLTVTVYDDEIAALAADDAD